MVNALQVRADDESDDIEPDYDQFQNLCLDNDERYSSANSVKCQQSGIVSCVEVVPSPNLICYYKNLPFKVIIDSGATSNIVSLRFVKSSGMPLCNTNQGAKQLDGSFVKTRGEVDVVLEFGTERLRFIALVIENADSDILGGMPFCKRNGIDVSLLSDEIYIRGKVIKYGDSPGGPKGTRVFKAAALLLRSPVSTVVFPDESLQV